MKLSETLKKVIDLARTIDDYWERELPKRHPQYPIVQEGADSGPPPPEEKRLRDLFKSLSDETIYKIALIMHLGRDDFNIQNIAESYKSIKERYKKAEHAANRMIFYSPLADQLFEGLEKLTEEGIDVDKLPLRQAAVQ